MAKRKVNMRLNRVECNNRHIYFTDFGIEPIQDHEHFGYVKCKLIHARWGSVILPDQLYLGNDAAQWIQPLSFTPPQLAKIDDNDIRVSFYVDISCGNTVRVDFNHTDLVRKGGDGSEFFTCRIKGISKIDKFSTGTSRLNGHGVPEIFLYHHTSEATKPLIENSGYFLGSKWNIQGNKELANVSYVYFTCIDKISTHEDLKQIAMASDGRIYLIRDGFEPPPMLHDYEVKEKYGSEIIELQVYRESTVNRTATIKVFVSSEDLASQHLLFHKPPARPAYYEICRPFIYRVGIQPGSSLPIDSTINTVRTGFAKHFSHIVAGDATNFEGLRAPFDEENTEDIFKIERIPNDESMISFWFKYPNQDHFSGKKLEHYEFK